MLTLAEYLEDYASNEVKVKGYKLIEKNLDQMEADKIKAL
jgi:2-iminoacetate synthase